MKKYTHFSASFTIEAAIIFPILLIVLFMYITLIFSVHDTVVTKAFTYRSLISYAQNNSDTDYTYPHPFYETFFDTLNQRLFLSNMPELQTYFTTNNLSYHSNTFNTPSVFSNYNHTDSLLQYEILKTASSKKSQS